jgi:hypothetical protein
MIVFYDFKFLFKFIVFWLSEYISGVTEVITPYGYFLFLYGILKM